MRVLILALAWTLETPGEGEQEARKSEYEELLERKEKRGYDPG
jgi:hypothetical protein